MADVKKRMGRGSYTTKSIRIAADVGTMLDDYAWRMRTSVSAAAERLLRDSLEREKAAEPGA